MLKQNDSAQNIQEKKDGDYQENQQDADSVEIFSKNWGWVPCAYKLKLGKGIKNSSFLNLAPQIMLTNPRNTGNDPNVKLIITTEKPFEFNQELGWTWHKSWSNFQLQLNLPNIQVKISIKDPYTQEPLLAPKNLFCKIFSVKPFCSESKEFMLVNVGLKGQTQLELFDCESIFNGIKFKSTSYNNDGQRFHILIVVFIQNEANEYNKVLISLISPPLFVDSRKQDKFYENEQVKFHFSNVKSLQKHQLNSFIMPFPPEQLEKIFVKRENKKNKRNRNIEKEIQVQNNYYGLYNYLSAPNIRNKIKHPIFLCVRFSNCCTLYYDHKSIKDNLELEQLILYLQQKLYKNQLCDNQEKDGSPKNGKAEFKLVLLYPENIDQSQILKLSQLLSPINCTCFSLDLVSENDKNYFSDENFADYRQLSNHGQIGNAYKNIFQQLCNIVNSDQENIKKQYQLQQQNEFEQLNEENEENSQSEKNMSSPSNVEEKSSKLEQREGDVIYKKLIDNQKNSILIQQEENKIEEIQREGNPDKKIGKEAQTIILQNKIQVQEQNDNNIQTPKKQGGLQTNKNTLFRSPNPNSASSKEEQKENEKQNLNQISNLTSYKNIENQNIQSNIKVEQPKIEQNSLQNLFYQLAQMNQQQQNQLFGQFSQQQVLQLLSFLSNSNPNFIQQYPIFKILMDQLMKINQHEQLDQNQALQQNMLLNQLQNMQFNNQQNSQLNFQYNQYDQMSNQMQVQAQPQNYQQMQNFLIQAMANQNINKLLPQQNPQMQFNNLVQHQLPQMGYYYPQQQNFPQAQYIDNNQLLQWLNQFKDQNK